MCAFVTLNKKISYLLTYLKEANVYEQLAQENSREVEPAMPSSLKP